MEILWEVLLGSADADVEAPSFRSSDWADVC